MLHLSKVAYGCASLAELVDRVAARFASEGMLFMTTRYMPKRQSEIVGQGSLFWIIKHQLVARASIIRFDPTSDGKIDIVLDPAIVPVTPFPRRAHQGWRYLEEAGAPPDICDGGMSGDILPPALIGELADLSLL
jgi:hypothetical protein